MNTGEIIEVVETIQTDCSIRRPRYYSNPLGKGVSIELTFISDPQLATTFPYRFSEELDLL